jgi:hypothetical protein
MIDEFGHAVLHLVIVNLLGHVGAGYPGGRLLGLDVV